MAAITPTPMDRTEAGADKSDRYPVLSYYLLVAATGILVVIGAAVVLSSSAVSSGQRGGNPFAMFYTQLAALVVGLIAMVVVSRLNIKSWKMLTPIVLWASVGLLVMVVLFGFASGGNRNWLYIKSLGLTLQPSEIAKLGLALYLGMVLQHMRRRFNNWQGVLFPAAIIVGLVFGLVMVGKDMGTGLVLLLIAAGAYWVAGLPFRFFAQGSVVVLIVLVVLFQTADSRVKRLAVWLSDECDVTDACYQQLHGTWALATGGLWGLGPGMSREKWGYLPHADNDYIFAIVGEEFGLVGTLIVLFAFGMIAVAVNRIVGRHTSVFAKIVAGGLGAWLVGQALINIGVVLELLPVAGVPLPMVSSGGSSLVSSLLAMGALMAFARTEPGAAQAFSARPSVLKRSFAVLARRTRG